MRSQAVGTPSITLPATSANLYQPLSDYLNQRWQQLGKEALTLRCAPREGRLLVLVEHVITVQPNLTVTFERIKDLLEAAPPEVWTAQDKLNEPPAELGVTMYIRVANQKQSYGECEWEIIPLKQFLDDSETAAPSQSAPQDTPKNGPKNALKALPPSRETDLDTIPEADLESHVDADLEIDLDADLDADLSGEIAIDPEMAAAFSPDYLRLEPLPEVQAPGSPNGNGTERHASERHESERHESERYESERYDAERYAAEAEIEAEIETEAVREPFYIPRSIWAAGLGLCLLTFAGSFYIASRPCWFRTCAPLALAQQQGQEVNTMLQVASTWEDLEKARLALDGAIAQLRGVPGWTSYGQPARGLRDRYRKTLKSLTPIQDALKQAELAEEKSQNTLLKTKQWQEIQVYWEAAIAQLRGVSPQSPMYALAQDKLTQYEKNLALVQSRVGQEETGQELLRKARAIANEIPKKDEDLDPLTFLQRSQIKLQDALYTLRQVPRTASAYPEAIQLISRYESELAVNQGQQSKEGFIVNTYQSALASAEAAKVSESQDKWEDARDHWKAAIENINQVPDSSSTYFAKAQGLIPEYAYALQQAEQKAQQFAKLGNVERDLAKVCQGTPQICTYKATPQLLAVTLTLDYERAVLTAGSVGDEQSRVGALNHVYALESALEEVSNAAQIPLELYDPDGVMVGMHQPRGNLGAI